MEYFDPYCSYVQTVKWDIFGNLPFCTVTAPLLKSQNKSYLSVHKPLPLWLWLSYRLCLVVSLAHGSSLPGLSMALPPVRLMWTVDWRSWTASQSVRWLSSIQHTSSTLHHLTGMGCRSYQLVCSFLPWWGQKIWMDLLVCVCVCVCQIYFCLSLWSLLSVPPLYVSVCGSFIFVVCLACTCMLAHLSAGLSVHLKSHLSLCPSFPLSVCLAVFMFICLPSVCLSFHLCVCRSVSVFVLLPSVSQSVFLSLWVIIYRALQPTSL